jgi:hypothetical protein
MSDRSELVPNFTQIPNLLLHLTRDLSDAELRVLLVLCFYAFMWPAARPELGWREHSEALAASEIGKVAGLAEGVTQAALARCIENGWVERYERAPEHFFYALRVVGAEEADE